MSVDKSEKPFVALRVAVLTVSDTRSLATDTSGQYLVDQLTDAGHVVTDRAIVIDDIYQIRARISTWIAADDVQTVIITGGTGFSGRDSTPEAVLPLLDKTIDGFGELFRHISYGEIGTSTLQSRALAGLANRTAIFCVPGSTSACRTAWEGILSPQLDNRTRPCNLVPHLKPVAACDSRG